MEDWRWIRDWACAAKALGTSWRMNCQQLILVFRPTPVIIWIDSEHFYRPIMLTSLVTILHRLRRRESPSSLSTFMKGWRWSSKISTSSLLTRISPLATLAHCRLREEFVSYKTFKHLTSEIIMTPCHILFLYY